MVHKRHNDTQTSFVLLTSTSLALTIRRCKRRPEDKRKQERHFWVRKIFFEEKKE